MVLTRNCAFTDCEHDAASDVYMCAAKIGEKARFSSVFVSSVHAEEPGDSGTSSRKSLHY